LLQAGEAIAEAHGIGIVHRDLKPSNLFLTQRADGSSCVKVLDFGISKLTAASASADQTLTDTLAVLGSPMYMSPEQLMSSRNVDMRTDIWSLGVICYELLTGKLPFDGETLPQLCMSINLSPPKPLRVYRPDLPLAVEEMLLRCLEKSPEKRFPNVAALATELVKYAPPHALLSAGRIDRLARSAGFSSGPLEAPLSSSRSVAAAEPSNLTLMGSSRSRSTLRTSSSTRRWGVGLTMVLLAGAAAAFAWSRSTTTPELESATQPSLPAPTAPPPLPAAPSATLQPAPPIVSPMPAEPNPAPASSPVAPPSAPPPSSAVVVQSPSMPATGRRPAATSSTVVKRPARVDPTPAATDCSVPYLFDARGNKVFKKACL
jgi:serine/threonine-protein kinase